VLHALTEYIIALLELLESEGRNARRGLVKLVKSAAFVVIGALLLLAATGFLIWSLLLALTPVIGLAAAALICGLGLLGSAGLLLWLGTQQSK
jgi:hypothetical protein